MFTGLIQHIGIINSLDKSRGDLRFGIASDMDMDTVKMGASICCSGCCLTVVDKSDNKFFIDVSAETLSKTILGEWGVGDKVNLEPSLKLGDEMGGHFVSGHVDGTESITDIKQDGDSRRVTISLNDKLKKYIAPKGSVTIDGISLTVNEVSENSFGVNIIPHTWDNTTLSNRNTGDKVNIEIDMLARYVARIIKAEEQ